MVRNWWNGLYKEIANTNLALEKVRGSGKEGRTRAGHAPARPLGSLQGKPASSAAVRSAMIRLYTSSVDDLFGLKSSEVAV